MIDPHRSSAAQSTPEVAPSAASSRSWQPSLGSLPEPYQERCPKSKAIQVYAAGGFSEADAAQLESHLLSCPECETLLDSLDDPSDAIIQALTSMPVSPDDEADYQRLRQQALTQPIEVVDDAELTALIQHASRLADPALGPLPYRLGNYELSACIGRGASGAVYRAEHVKLHQRAAVKVLDASRTAATAAFLQEMKTIGSLAHPHIVRATDAGEAGGLHFLVMEYVEGIDAARLLFRNGPLRACDACEIARQTALGLQFVHQRSLVHRDIKPSNLLVTVEGQVKILDLGIAVRSDRAPLSQTLEQATGEPMRAASAPAGPQGTLDYMAPEQFSDSTAIDARADLFSLGCTLFRLLTGQAPPKPYAAYHDERAEIPRAIDRLLQRLLAPDPEDRPTSADTVIAALRPHTRGSALAALVASVAPTGKRAPPVGERRRSKWSPLSRRAAIATLTAASASAVLLSRPPFRWTPQLRRVAWRPLAPVSPEILLSVGNRTDVHIGRSNAEEFTISSDDLALIHLGRPVTGSFVFEVRILPDRWPGGGLFFQGRTDATDDVRVLRFQTIELKVQKGQAQTAIDRHLLWSQWRAEQRDDRLRVEHSHLAEVPVELEEHPQGQQLQITCGQQGMPEIVWNGKKLHESMWQLSVEARAQLHMSVNQHATAFLGRLGLLNPQGKTTYLRPRLAYL